MTSRDFCYWLQGHFELNASQQGLTPEQTEMIRKHLNLVFVHEIDPSQGEEGHQQLLNEIHEGKPSKPTSPSKPFPHRPPGARC